MSAETNLRAGRRSACQARPRSRKRRPRGRRRLPPVGRIVALGLLAASLAGAVALVHGPWLRVQQVTFAGTRFTAPAAVEELLDAYVGTPVLALDSRALAERLLALPAVAGARVEPLLPGELRVTIDEKQPAVVWLTSAVRLISAADGTLIAEMARDAELPPEIADLPVVDDQRRSSRTMTMGDVIDAAELRTGLALLALDPARLGSATTRLAVRIDEVYGFVLVSGSPAWRAAIGFPGREAAGGTASIGMDAASTAARLDRQVAAIRTLFASTEEDGVTWVDVRNPGKVYWAR